VADFAHVPSSGSASACVFVRRTGQRSRPIEPTKKANRSKLLDWTDFMVVNRDRSNVA
jgi:hypothetical protein